MGLVSSVSIGLLSNTIFDLVKFAGQYFFCRKKGKDLRDLVEQEINKSIPDDLSQLLESSTFISFFNTPQFLDVINAYIEYKILCDSTCENEKIKKYINKNGIISFFDVVKYISGNISNLYSKHNVISVPSNDVVERAVNYILSTTERVIARIITPETSQALFFLNSRADMQYKSIISSLSKLQNTVDQIQAKQITPTNGDYEKTKEKYHSVLKERNSVAHIYLLDKFPFENFYVPPILQRSPTEGDKINIIENQFVTSWNDIFHQSNIVYLTGGAGYGKSLFTKKIINDYNNLNIFRSEEYLVICGELKAFYPSGSDSAISVIEFLRASIRSSTLMDVSPEFVEHYLNAGRCIILLDALDEVEKTRRVALHESVIAFFKSQNPNNKICLTSRDRGFIPERNVEVLKICPLDESQIEKYVNKIIALGKFEKQDKETFMKQSKELVRKGFLNSFLVLSLLINIYKAELELPENKLELYQKCFEYIANKREKDKTQKEFDWKIISPIMKDNTFIELSRMGLPNNSNIDRKDIKERLLSIYKTKYGCEAEAENAIEEFLKFCSDRTELFVPTVEDKYKFFHRSFFEYFYSLYIFYRCRDENEMLTELLKFDVDSEVFELTVAMLKQKSETKYQALIELMFESAEKEINSTSIDYSVLNILILTMPVIDDALYKKRFLNIIITKKSVLLSDIHFIHNLRVIATVYENDGMAYQKICECYHDEGLLYLFDNCDNIFSLVNKYEKNMDESDLLSSRVGANQKRYIRHLIFPSQNEDEFFYMSVFSKVWDFKKILLETSEEVLLNLFKKQHPRNYKKKTKRVRAEIEQIRGLPVQKQEELINIIAFQSIQI